MSQTPQHKPSLGKKILKKVNPVDPEGLITDPILSGGRPTSGIDIPGIGPSIDLNHDEALAAELRRSLPRGWAVEVPSKYWEMVNEAKALGYDGNELIEYARSKHLNALKHPDYQNWIDPHVKSDRPAGSPAENNPDKYPVKLPPSPGGSSNGEGQSFPVKISPSPQPDKAGEMAPAQKQSSNPIDPRAASIVAMAESPVIDPGHAAILKPVEQWTEGEMKDALSTAQTGFKGWRTGDPMKSHFYERVQDWHTHVYGDGEQATDGGKPVEPKPIVAVPEQPAPHRTPEGEDLWQATGRIGWRVAEAAGTDGLDDAVRGLQRGLNLLGQQPLPKRSPAWGPYTKPAPLAEDGAYGPKTDFALKHATARLGAPKVEEAFALGRFNTFARQAQKTGSVDGLEQKTHGIFGPLFRTDDSGPKVEAGVLQETLNGFGAELKVDDWIGPKTTAAFGRVLKDEDADELTRRFGTGLGLL